MTEEQIHRYARHIVLSSVGMRGQQRLLKASVTVVARPGEWTSHCALALLAAAGIGQLVVGEGLDVPLGPDEIRQSLLFDQTDVGDSHFDALSKSIAKLNPDAELVRQSTADVTEEIEIGHNAASSLTEGLIHGAAVATEAMLSIAASEQAGRSDA